MTNAAIDSLCYSTGLTMEELATAFRAIKAHLLADPKMVALAKANTAADFYDGLPLVWEHIEDAILAGSEDVRALYAAIDPADVAALLGAAA